MIVRDREDREDVEAAFEVLYRRELRSMIALAAALSGSRETGADLAHEAMLRAYLDWAHVGRLDRPGAWVRRVVINLAGDLRRRGVREQRALQRLDADVHAAAPTAVNAPFWAAVRSLPERQRAAVALRYLDDLAIDEIAQILEVTTGTVKAALFAGRKTLAGMLGTTGVVSHDDDR